MPPDLNAATLILISGDEEALRKRQVEAVIALAGGSDSLELESALADETPVNQWVSVVSTLPFLEDRRTYLVRHLLRLADPGAITQEWTATFKGLPSTARLVLVADDEPGDDTKQKKLASNRQIWEKWVVACGGLVLADKVDPKALKQNLKAEAKLLPLSIADSALDLLIEMTAGSYSASLQELQKLGLYADGTSAIHENDIRRLVVPAREWKIYNLIDAALDGRVGTALQEWKTLVSSGAKAADTALGRLFPSMANQLRLIWLMKAALTMGASPEAIAERVAARLPKSPNLKDLPDWRLRRLAGPAREHSFAHLSRCIQALAEADAKIKGQVDAYSAEDTIEQMILQLAPKGVAKR